MAELNHVTRVDQVPSERQIDPEVEKAARHADVPDGTVYDTSNIDDGGAGNMPVLVLVLTFVGLLLFVFAYVAFAIR